MSICLEADVGEVDRTTEAGRIPDFPVSHQVSIHSIHYTPYITYHSHGIVMTPLRSTPLLHQPMRWGRHGATNAGTFGRLTAFFPWERKLAFRCSCALFAGGCSHHGGAGGNLIRQLLGVIARVPASLSSRTTMTSRGIWRSAMRHGHGPTSHRSTIDHTQIHIRLLE